VSDVTWGKPWRPWAAVAIHTRSRSSCYSMVLTACRRKSWKLLLCICSYLDFCIFHTKSKLLPTSYHLC